MRQRMANKTTAPMAIGTAAERTFPQVVLCRFPMVQCTIVCSLKGSLRTCTMVRSAVKMPFTMTPERIRETIDTPR